MNYLCRFSYSFVMSSPVYGNLPGTVGGDGTMKGRATFDYGIGRVLLVAGVSGAGKSTFIDALLRRAVAPEIRQALPEDVHLWKCAFGREQRGLFRRNSGAAPGGQIVHQEITEAMRHGLRQSLSSPPTRSYRVDQIPRRVAELEAAREIFVVVVRPSQTALVKQMNERSAVIHFPVVVRNQARRYVSQIERLERALPRFMTNNAARLLGRGWARRAHMRAVNDQLAGVYGEQNAVENIYGMWEASLYELFGAKIAAPPVYVEPSPTHSDAKAFRLAEATPRVGAGFSRRRASERF
jgi:adenylate kinase family enzyme